MAPIVPALPGFVLLTWDYEAADFEITDRDAIVAWRVGSRDTGIASHEQLFVFDQIVPKLVLPIPATLCDFYRMDQSLHPQWSFKQGRASHKWQIPRKLLRDCKHEGKEPMARISKDAEANDPFGTTDPNAMSKGEYEHLTEQNGGASGSWEDKPPGTSGGGGASGSFDRKAAQKAICDSLPTAMSLDEIKNYKGSQWSANGVNAANKLTDGGASYAPPMGASAINSSKPAGPMPKTLKQDRGTMFKFLTAAFLVFMPSFALAAVATGQTTASTTAWTQVGKAAGPITIQCINEFGGLGANVLIAFGDSAPSSLTVGFRFVTGDPYFYTGTSKTWVIGTGSCVWSQ